MVCVSPGDWPEEGLDFFVARIAKKAGFAGQKRVHV